jgi:hypothetical protein
MGLSTPPLNVLAFIQTEPAPVLFQIHTDSCLSFHVRRNGAAFGNKIAVHPVHTHEAPLIGESLRTIWIKETGCASNSLRCPISTMLSTSRAGCCAVAKMPKLAQEASRVPFLPRLSRGDARAWLLQIVRYTCYS